METVAVATAITDRPPLGVGGTSSYLKKNRHASPRTGAIRQQNRRVASKDGHEGIGG
jgi:hypothetical protein